MFNRSSTGFNVFLFTLIFLVYLLLGAELFSTIERPTEQLIVNEMLKTRRDFLEKYPCVQENDFESFIVSLLEASKHGVDARTNFSTVDNWSFAQSFFFAVTVVTTIGYGHVSPLSDLGRTICVGYAVVGVPMTLLLLSIIVRKMLVSINQSYLWLRETFRSELRSDAKLRFIHLIFVVVLVILMFFIIPSIIFTYLEADWSFVDAFYFCFISLTTIGLGDLVAGDSPEQRNRLFYKICLTAYLLVGVTVMMTVVALVSQFPEFHLVHYFLSEKEVEEEHERLSHGDRTGLLWLSHSTSIHSYGNRNSTSSQPYRRQTTEREDLLKTVDIVTD